jgi:hypothetical protein
MIDEDRFIEDTDEEDISGLDVDQDDNLPTTEILITEVIESKHQLPNLVKESLNIAPDDTAAASSIVATGATGGAVVPQLEYAKNSSLDDDFEIARKNIIALTKAAPSIIEDLVALAKSSEHPNAYRALTDTLTTFAQLNKDLLGLYEQKKTIENKDKNFKEGNTIQNQNNTVFIGTTDELIEQYAKNGLLTLGNPSTDPIIVEAE